MKNKCCFVLALGAAVFFCIGWYRPSYYAASETIHVFYTNDTHSRIDSFPTHDKYFPGVGGAAKRMTIFKESRQKYLHTLFFDNGDVCQGTPYFNFFQGKLDYQLMTMLKYTAATLGNHDFDNGTDSLAQALEGANFDIINSNYEISHPRLKAKVKPYAVYERAGVKVGVFGLGIDFTGLVTPENHQGVEYRSPTEAAKKMVKILRENEKCTAVICLSHLGLTGFQKECGDRDLALQVSGIDAILGGHTHTYMETPEIIKSDSGWTTAIHQVGASGTRIGHLSMWLGSAKK